MGDINLSVKSSVLRSFILIIALSFSLISISALAINFNAPSVSSSTFTVSENAVAGTIVGTVSATDPEGDALTYSIQSGNDAGIFAIDPANGELRIENAGLDFEVVDQYSLVIQVVDSENMVAKGVVTVRIADEPEQPGSITGDATIVSPTSVKVEGTVRDNGSTTIYAVQYSAGTPLPEQDPSTLPNNKSVPAGSPLQAVAFNIKGLSPATTYYYRLVAKNSEGTVYGETKSFTTFSIPTVVSITRIGANPTNSTALKFLITFSEDIQNLEVSDFKVTKTGTATGTVSSLSSSTGSAIEVIITGVSGDGFLGLEFKDDDGVTSNNGVPVGGVGAGNGDFTTSETFQVDNTDPGIAISGPGYPYTQISPVNYVVTYTDVATINLSPADVTLITTGTATGTVEIINTSSTTRTVRINNISGDGTIKIQIAAGTASDAAGNFAPAVGPSNTVIVDNTAPVVPGCPPEGYRKVIANSNAKTCGAYLELKAPAYDDNLEPGVVVITNSRTGTADASGIYPVGITTVIWKYTDQSGNFTECTYIIEVNDTEAPAITCPTEIVVGTDNGACNAVVNYTLPVSDNCSAEPKVTQLAGLASGSVFPLGTTINTFEAVDDAGNKSTCSFKVTVVDNKAPVIACPANIEVRNEPGKDGAVVTFEAATAIDNCSAPGEIEIEQTSGLVSGSFFPIGTSAITYSAEDVAGNVTVCSFSVTVLDKDAPTIEISDPSVDVTVAGPVSYTVTYFGADNIKLTKGDINLNTTGTATAATITVTGTGNERTVTLSDISGNGTISISIAAGTASDNAGNYAGAAGPSKSFIVDNGGPVFTGLKDATTKEDIIARINFNVKDAVSDDENITVSVASGNTALFSNANILVEGTGADRVLVLAPATHLHGDAKITVTATDELGNSSTTEFTLTVEAVADAPEVTTVDAVGDEDTPIPLSFSADLVDTDGSELIKSYTIVNVQSGATFNVGTSLGNGVWVFTPDEIATIAITPPADFYGEFVLFVKATSIEASNNDEATNTGEKLLVVVRPINDPVVSNGVPDVTFFEDKENAFNVSAYFMDVDNYFLTYELEHSELPEWIQVKDGVITAYVEVLENPLTFEFKVTATDGEYTAEDDFILTVYPVNDVPVVSPIENVVVYLSDPVPPVTFKIYDEETPAADLTVRVTNYNKYLLPEENIKLERITADSLKLTLLPLQERWGLDTLSVFVSDNMDEGMGQFLFYVLPKQLPLNIPSLITPNGDGANDTWNIQNLSVYENHDVRIFDRKGKLIFRSQDYAVGREWDGSYNGEELPTGVYYYIIKVNSNAEQFRGTITIAR